VHPDDQALYGATLEEALRGNQGWHGLVLRWRHRDGGWRELESNASPLFDEHGRLTGLQGSDRDVTQRRRGENALRQSEARYRALFETMTQGAFVQRADGALLDVNPAALELFGLTRDEFLARTSMTPDWRVIGPDGSTMPGPDHPSMRALATGQPVRDAAVGVFNPRDSRLAWLVVNAIPEFHDGQTTPYQVFVTLHDVTEERQARALLTGQMKVMELIATGVPLSETLDELVRLIEAQAPGIRVSILLTAPDGAHLHHCVAPSLPAAYVRAIDGAVIGSRAGPCGTAAFRGEQVIVEDIAGDPLWSDYRDLALTHGLRACWSTPILDSGRQVLGTVGFYHASPCRPDERHLRLIDMAVQTASIAVARQREEAALRLSEGRFRHISSLTSDIAYSCSKDAEGGYAIDWISGASLAITGYTLDEIEAMQCWRGLVVDADRPLFDRWVTGLAPGESGSCQLRLRGKSGQSIWVESQAECAADPDISDARRLYGGLRDITERRVNEEKLRLAAEVFASTSEGILITDPNADIQAVNPAFSAITGYSEDEVRGRNPRLLQSGRHERAYYQAMWSSLLDTGHWRGEIWNRHKDGEAHPELLTISAAKDDAGETTHYIAVITDISQLKRSQEALDFLAHHDPLTRLPNRSLFRDRLDHALQRVQREHDKLALLFVDLDRFKNVNDTLGHPVGDELLRMVAQRMSEQLRGGDTLARVGGDEFVLLLEEDAGPRNAESVAHKLLELFSQPLRVGDRALFITASIGISLYPHDGDDADTLLKHADLAMYRAKEEGRNTYQFYEPILSAGAFERMLVENALRGAVSRSELLLHYQPQIELVDGSLAAVEALVRWQHPELGLVAPSRFIPVAEEMGIICEIGDWVLREACRQMAAWREAGLAIPRLSVNLSVQQIERGDLVATVRDLLADWGLNPVQLEMEVTESLLMRQTGRGLEVLEGLRQLGVYLAVDDFGTGYSSLAYLKRMPVHRLKIDQSFVRDIGRDPNDEAIVRAIVAMGQSLGLELIGEGVEQAQQADFLRAAGCQIAQGYLYGRPVSAEEIIARWSPRP
jgi:diguanylate cyclase (GGDEF)-like protein/PAS domain S-box-containing protein